MSSRLSSSQPDKSLLCVTQTGKVIQRESKSLEAVEIIFGKRTGADPAFAARTGSPLYRCGGGQGIQIKLRYWMLTGKINIHDAEAMTGGGSIEADGLILSIGVIPAEGGKRRIAS